MATQYTELPVSVHPPIPLSYEELLCEYECYLITVRATSSWASSSYSDQDRAFWAQELIQVYRQLNEEQEEVGYGNRI
jgi:hypothetical protein